ncbi:hypothetical protein V1J52_19410 [Streptomyces sp. TRM 70351]|uniref:hypothetical protein n=1 Tax=Streptomyces sp. TRM 70351 TaxID=3116552 RepID=UPI002E7AD068|nr:hypothetical protein [Streptomyces sp. TRM 70351]MEE1930323.1 hypothetical protein [Streptomyces sp. TRM 70351]
MSGVGFLEDWDLSYDEINELLTDNPSLRSFVMGYAAEIKCRHMYFHDHPGISAVYKPDDHDRTEKGDLIVTYLGHPIAVEVKSIQTASMAPRRRSGRVEPFYQCDASDRRTVVFRDGSSVETTALLVGEFDVVAVNIHAFTGQWDFVFARNEELPTMAGATRGAARHYTRYQQRNLIKTNIGIDLDPGPPYVRDPFVLFDRIVKERARGEGPAQQGVVAEEAAADGETVQQALDFGL